MKCWIAAAALALLPTGAGAVEIMVSSDPGDEALLRWLEDNNLCERIEVHADVEEPAIRALRGRGWEVVLQMMGHPESFDRRYINRPGREPLSEAERFTPGDVLQRHIAAAEGDASEVVWQFLLEEDSAGVAFPYRMLIEQPETHAEAHALFEQRLEEALAVAAPYRDRGVRLWGRAGYATSMHAFAKTGLEMNLIERTNDDIEDLSTGIAFARGAARQYGCDWGVDFSQWWGAIFSVDFDHSGRYFRRNFYLSYFAGADLLAIEYLRVPQDSRGAPSLGDALAEFSDFRHRVQAGAPDRPVAVLLPRDHGWMTPPYWRTQNESWNYARIPYRPGDASIDGVFAAAFPSSTFAMQPFPFGAYVSDDPPASPFALSSVTRQYTPTDEDVYQTAPPLPFGRFHDRGEARETLLAEGTDSSPYRPMADSRWGDIIDVLTDEAGADVLAKYPVLVAAGPLDVTSVLEARLRNYVERGGTLVWAVGVARPEHAKWIGLELEPEFRVGRAWQWREEDPAHEPFLYLPARPSEDTEVLARSGGGQPLVAAAPLGEGRVVTVLAPWFASEQSPLAGFALRALDEFIAPVQSVAIDGLPVQWTSTREADSRTVAVANHADVKWEGTVRLLGHNPEHSTCTELRSGRRLDFDIADSEARVRIAIEPYDVSVVRWGAPKTQTSEMP